MADDKTSVNLRAYTINGYQAPDRCEMCDIPVPDQESRQKHMDETGHRGCPRCGLYVPVGSLYAHCGSAHANEPLNDHQVVYQDNQDTTVAQSWVFAEQRKIADDYFEAERKKWLEQVMKTPEQLQKEKEEAEKSQA
ncbi:hypothetical protein ACJ41O_006387 [Fusarium nematophilum]